jgi:hypothetical protein
MIGYAVAIRRADGSLFLATPAHGFATPVWFQYSSALDHARAAREEHLDAVVVKVDYTEPIIIGPKRFATPASPTKGAQEGKAS